MDRCKPHGGVNTLLEQAGFGTDESQLHTRRLPGHTERSYRACGRAAKGHNDQGLGSANEKAVSQPRSYTKIQLEVAAQVLTLDPIDRQMSSINRTIPAFQRCHPVWNFFILLN